MKITALLIRRNEYCIQPFIKLFNANNEGSYATEVNPFVKLNELQQLEIFLFEVAREALVNQALKGELNIKKDTPFLKKYCR